MSEHDEYLLSRLLDDDLPAAEAGALRRRMEAEPELRSVFDSLTGVDELLQERRADRPTVDWPAFHERVVQAVRAEGEVWLRPIPFIRWITTAAAPLAAAAAIAMIVALPLWHLRAPVPGGSGHTLMVNRAGPTTPAGDEPVVHINRPGAVAERGAEHDQVTYARSAELDRMFQPTDEPEPGQGSTGSVVSVGRPPELEIGFLTSMSPL